MTDLPQLMITLDSDGSDPARDKQSIELLKRNLSCAGIRFAPYQASDASVHVGLESRSDAGCLYTLVLTFVTSGAAVALINAVRTTLAAMHSSQINFRIANGNKTIEISGDHLSSSRSGQLLDMLKEELRS
jgi:hypothetical protein